jgi:hypothetical protein
MSYWQNIRFGLTFVTHSFQYFEIVNFVDCLSSWYKFIMNNPSNVEKVSKKLRLLIWTDGIFCSWGIGCLPVCTLPLRFRVILVDPCFITCDYTAQHVILSIQKALKNLDSTSVCSFGTIFGHTFSFQVLQLRFS